MGSRDDGGGVCCKVVNSAVKDQAESSPQSGEMFIAMRPALIKSASSEMLSISLDAEEEKAGAVSINMTCLRHVPLPRYAPTVLQQSHGGAEGSFSLTPFVLTLGRGAQTR